MSNYSEENYTLDEVRTLTWAKILEESALKSKRKNITENLDKCTESVKQQVKAENGSVKEFLLKRASAVSKLIRPRLYSLPQFGSTAIWVILILVIIGAVLLGWGAGDIGKLDKRINLVALPFVGLFVWNLFIYIILMCKRHPESVRGFRALLGRAVVKIQKMIASISSLKNPAVAEFYDDWFIKEKDLLMQEVAKICHIGAIAFAIATIFSMLGSGWSTSYRAGWESTILGNGAVEFIIRVGYPLSNFFCNLTTETINSMNFDNSPAGEPAAFWFWQIIAMVVIVIVLPRIYLYRRCNKVASGIRQNFPIDLESPYYKKLIEYWMLPPAQTEPPISPKLSTQSEPSNPPEPLSPVEPLILSKQPEALQSLHSYPVQSRDVLVLLFEEDLSSPKRNCISDLAKTIFPGTDISFVVVEDELSSLPNPIDYKAGEVWVIFLMESTPETEVHVSYAKKVNELCTKDGILSRILVVTDSFEDRFSNIPERIRQRRNNWSNQLDKIGVGYAFVNLSRKAEAQRIKKDWQETSAF